MHKAGTFVVCAGLLALLLPRPAAAAGAVQWDTNGVAICTADGAQSGSVIVNDGTGGTVIVWQDNRSGNYDIYAQRISANGTAQWTADGVAICTATGAQSSPAIVNDNTDGTIIVWQDERNGTARIYAQRINAAGTVQWEPNGVAICTAGGAQSSPVVEWDDAGGATIIWQDERSGNADIYAQRISYTGAVLWTPDGVPICTAIGAQSSPAIGWTVVTWIDERDGNADIYAQRISANGMLQWESNGVPVCTAIGAQTSPAIVYDGTWPVGMGGTIITWQDERRNGDADIYAQRISATGVVDWTPNGVAICIAEGAQLFPTIVNAPFARGVIVAWQDNRSVTNSGIYAQRISSGGEVQWAPDGVALCAAIGNQEYPTIVADGAEGAIVTWQDDRNGNYDIYAQWISPSAQGPTQDVLRLLQEIGHSCEGPFPAPTRLALATARRVEEKRTAERPVGIPSPANCYVQRCLVTCPNGNIGFYVTVRDAANNPMDGSMVELDFSGCPSFAACEAGPGYQIDPVGRRVWTLTDVTGEAGFWLRMGGVCDGLVRVSADGFFLCNVTLASPDQDGNGVVGPIDLALLFEKLGTFDLTGDLDCDGKVGGVLPPEYPRITNISDIPNDEGGHVWVTWNASSLDADLEIRTYTLRRWLNGEWLDVDSVYAAGAESYIIREVHTSSDVTPGQPFPWTVFRIVAKGLDGMVYGSYPDSGYSVDNRAPQPPSLFTGEYASGTATLRWAVNLEADLAEYRLYRGDSADFVLEPGNLIAVPPDTGYVDVAGAVFYYKLTAVDVHGNESDFVALLPSDAVDAPSDASLAFALEGVRPNPSYGDRLSVAFTLPTVATARLELLDVSGRRLVEREVGSLGAGPHAVDIGQGQHLAPGLYLVRLTQGANKRTTRVAVLR
jgi:hypothetical protein